MMSDSTPGTIIGVAVIGGGILAVAAVSGILAILRALFTILDWALDVVVGAAAPEPRQHPGALCTPRKI